MNRAKIVIRSFTRFTPVPKDLKDEEHVFASIAMYKDFLERVLYKWNESFTIQITTHGLVMHFTRHKDWGSVTTAAMPHESMIYTESFLCLRFFQLLQTMLRNNTTIVYHSLYTQQGRNLLADYCVHLLQLLGTAQGAQGGSLRRHKSMILVFWKSYEPRINERLSNLMTNGGEVSIDAPLSWKRVEQWRVWREIVQKKKGTQVTPTFRRPRVAAIKARAAAGKEREPCLAVDLFGQNGFSYPFTTPFRHTCLPRFTYARSSASIPTHVKIFFGELKRLLSTDLYVEGRYAKNAEREYTFCLMLYLEGWKWLVRRHGAPVFKKTSRVGEHGSDMKESLRAFEEEMSTCLWEGIVKALIMPSSAVDVVEKCQKVASKKIASKAAQLMISLKALRAISGEATVDAVPIWEQPFWKAKANHCWSAAGFKIDGEEAAIEEEEWPMGEIDVNANVEVEEDSESDDEDWEEPSRWKRNEDGVVEPVKKTDIEESSDLLSINAPKELCVLKKSFKLNMLPNNLSIYFRNICKFMEQVLLSTGMSLKLVHKMAEENESEGISMSFVSEDNEEVFKMQCNNKQPKPGFHFILEEAFWRLKEANGLDPEIVPLLESEDSMKVVRLFSFTDRFLNDLMFQ